MSLTAKQEAFVKAFLESGNASHAYRIAYAAGNMKDSAIHANAHKLLKHTEIAQRVEAARKTVQRKTEMSVERLTRMALKAYKLAMKESVEAPSAAVAAVMAIGKLHGLIVDKKEVTRKRDAADFSDDELLEIARLGRAGASTAQGSSEEPDRVH